jgi:diguanylate cyclase (GGDEF)-like protein
MDELTLLRQVLRARALTAVPTSEAVSTVTEIDDVIDDLLTRRSALEVSTLEQAAFLDPLTGAANRRALDRDLGRELARVTRHDRTLAVGALDVDGLKGINDRDGHPAGDDCLREVTGALQGSLRAADTVYRVGGDEFVVLLPDTPAAEAARTLERVRKSAPSFSFGVASAPEDGVDAHVLLEEADRRLLESRRQVRSDPGPAVIDLRDPRRDAGAPATGSPTRPSLTQVQVSVEGSSCQVQVTLDWADRRLVGEASGSSVSTSQRMLVANALLDALATTEAGLLSAHVAQITPVRSGEADAVVVHVVLAGPAVEEQLLGIALVRSSLPEAVARALLDALNRRVVMRQPTARHPA